MQNQVLQLTAQRTMSEAAKDRHHLPNDGGLARSLLRREEWPRVAIVCAGQVVNQGQLGLSPGPMDSLQTAPAITSKAYTL